MPTVPVSTAALRSPSSPTRAPPSRRQFLGRQIVVGSTLATIVGADGTTLDLAPQLPSPPVDDTPYLVENELLGAVHVLSAMTPDTLQDTLAMAEASLGNGSTIDFGLAKNDAGDEQLRLDLSWARAYEVTQPVSLSLGDDLDVIGLSSGGELSVAASGTVKLRLYLPLTAAAMLSPIDNTKVDKDWSEVSFTAKVAADNAYFGANLGPISLELGRDSDGDRGSVHAGFAVKASGATTEEDPSIADFFTDGFDLAVGGGDACAEDDQVVCAEFPLWANGTKVTGNLKVTTTLGAQEDSLTDLFTGASTEVTYPLEIKNILENGAFKFGSLLEGVQQYMFYSETALRTASNGGEMPVVGKDLQAGADFMGKVRGDLATFIEDNGDVSQVGPAKKLLTDGALQGARGRRRWLVRDPGRLHLQAHPPAPDGIPRPRRTTPSPPTRRSTSTRSSRPTPRARTRSSAPSRRPPPSS